ncbi:unnamed protein product [Moneuplotes crassus]|uniref:Uncharacterized protein n=1 Tax=Euplotes crassus TaxID=5936 RepID=A0AAD1XQK4_EUPCR|nr:unnamed protein product [Moneuplotes crassus]
MLSDDDFINHYKGIRGNAHSVRLHPPKAKRRAEYLISEIQPERVNEEKPQNGQVDLCPWTAMNGPPSAQAQAAEKLAKRRLKAALKIAEAKKDAAPARMYMALRR